MEKVYLVWYKSAEDNRFRLWGTYKTKEAALRMVYQIKMSFGYEATFAEEPVLD